MHNLVILNEQPKQIKVNVKLTYMKYTMHNLVIQNAQHDFHH